MYRDDEQARTDRANALIDEIADLERRKVLQAANDRRLEAAKAELVGLQSNALLDPVAPVAPVDPAPLPPAPRRFGVAAHAAAFCASAVATFAGYALFV
ncbi:MAG: hypothetical protein KIT31_23705 [Deltaproteobacteria bacterium]|nr:hypothetical protein [Deltaproteobacteria bacterium]